MSVPELDRFRVALKFTLWAWAFYWPVGGLMLLVGGLDIISLGVTLASLGAFVALFFYGGLTTASSRTRFEFFMERPIYLLAALVLVTFAAAALPAVETWGLIALATLLFGSYGLLIKRTLEYTRSTGKGIIGARTDQALLVIGLSGFAALMVFLDAWVTAGGGDPISGPPIVVAVLNWLSLLYPPMMLVATKGLREPLRSPRRRPVDEPEPVPSDIPARA